MEEKIDDAILVVLRSPKTWLRMVVFVWVIIEEDFRTILDIPTFLSHLD